MGMPIAHADSNIRTQHFLLIDKGYHELHPFLKTPILLPAFRERGLLLIENFDVLFGTVVDDPEPSTVFHPTRSSLLRRADYLASLSK